MNRYKVICEGAEYFVEAYHYVAIGPLHFFSHETFMDKKYISASFIEGYWKAVMICDDNEGREVYRCDKCKAFPELKSVKAFTDSQKVDRVCESV